jgi:hypothetical protein
LIPATVSLVLPGLAGTGRPPGTENGLSVRGGEVGRAAHVGDHGARGAWSRWEAGRKWHWATTSIFALFIRPSHIGHPVRAAPSRSHHDPGCGDPEGRDRPHAVSWWRGHPQEPARRVGREPGGAVMARSSLGGRASSESERTTLLTGPSSLRRREPRASQRRGRRQATLLAAASARSHPPFSPPVSPSQGPTRSRPSRRWTR